MVGHASGPLARFGGIRTFTLLGGLGGLAGWLAVSGLLPLAVVVLAGSASLVVSPLRGVEPTSMARPRLLLSLSLPLVR